MSDYFEQQDRAASFLEQTGRPAENRGLPPVEPVDPATRRLQSAPVISDTDLQDQAAAWQEQGNVRDWIDELNNQAAFLSDRKHADPTGALSERYLSALAIGHMAKLDPGFVFDNLEMFSEQIMGEKLPIATLGKAIANAWRRGWIGNRIAMLHYELGTGASGDRAAGIRAQVQDYESKLPPADPYSSRFLHWALAGTAGSLPLMIESGIEGAKTGLLAAGAAAIMAAGDSAIAGAALAATGIGAAPALVTATSATAAAALAAFGPGFAVGNNLRLSQLMIGQSYQSLSQIKDANGNQIRPWLRSALALCLGLVQARLESMQLETVLASMGPNMATIFGQGVMTVTRDTILKSVGNRVVKAAAKWGVDAGTQGLEEGSQQLTQRMGERLAMYIENQTAGAGFEYQDVRELIAEIRDATALGAVAGGIMVGPGHIFSPFAEVLAERSPESTAEQSRRTAERQQLVARLQAELQKAAETEKVSALASSAAEVKGVPPLEAIPVVEFEQPPAETPVQPGTFGENIRQDLANAQAWEYTPQEWARIEQSRGPVERTSTVSIYKDFFDPQLFPVRAAIAAAAPRGFDIDAIEMTGLLLDTLARAQGQSTQDFVKDVFAPGIFATPEQIQALPERFQEEARRQAEARGVSPEGQTAAHLQAQIKVAAAKGVAEFFKDGKALVYLFKSADISTATEEFAHIMRRRLPSPMLEAAARWAGAIDGVWSEEAEEKFANGLLEYLRQGLAPNEEVRNIFQRLAEWLEYIYKAIRDRWQLSPEIIQVYDSLFASRGPIGQKLNTDPNPRPADTLNMLFQIDPAPKSIDTDPARVSDEQFLRSSIYQKEIEDVYFDVNGNIKTVMAQGRLHRVTQRTMPVLGLRLHEGQWLIEDTLKGPYGHEIAQLRRLDPFSLELQEADYTTGVNWEGRGDDARRYARWMQQGLTPPPITVVEGPGGQMRVTDGHRRVAAAKLTQKQVFAWVWPAMDHPQGRKDSMGRIQRVGLTFEAAVNRTWKPEGTFAKFLFQVDPRAQEAFNKQVKEFFGTTTDLRKSAYILSTGEMLDFANKWGQTEMVMVDVRMRHRMVGKVPTVGMIDAVNKALRMGAARMDFDPAYSILQTMEDPTEGQYDAIDRLCNASKTVQVEKVDSRTGALLAFKEFPRATVQNVRDFFQAAEFYSPKSLFQTDPWLLKSQLVVLDKMKGPMSGDQVRAMLVNAGVKADEMKWVGLDEFLRGKEKKTREEVLRFIAENAVRIEEVLKAFNVEEQRLETKFDTYQLPGGENYRELLLTLPMPAPREPTFWAWYAKTHIGGVPPTAAVLELAQRRYESEKELMPREGAFYGGHYREPNVLVHMRFDDRTDEEGRRVLFIEEIQSDLHQEGRKVGYAGTGFEVFDPKDGIPVATYATEAEARAHAERENNLDYAPAAEGRVTGPQVPAAPFAKTWHELAFKRMLRWAVEKGYDAIAWTTGTQQAERYDLSKQVASIDITKNPDGSFNWEAYDKLGQQEPEPVAQQTAKNAKELGSQIGKDLAKKAVEQKPGSAETYTGEQLKIGGEGMKGFYDKILVDFANKYGKKWGAAVGDLRVETSKELLRGKPVAVIPDRSGMGKFTLSFPDTDETWGAFNSREQAEKELQRLQAGVILPAVVHSLPITPAMRSSVKAGVFQQFLMQPDTHEAAVQAAVAKGDQVPDPVLEIYKDRDWAKGEIQARKRYVQEARSGQFRDVGEFVNFHDAMEEPGAPIRSFEYWQMIWQRAGGDINVAGEAGFTPVPLAEANKRFLKTVNTPEKMSLWLSGLDVLTHKQESTKGEVIQGWWGYPKAIELAYKAGAGMPVETWAAAFKAMKTEPERYREVDAALGDTQEQRQLDAERTMAPAEETRLREENAKLRRELKLFRLAEEEQLAQDSPGKQLWELTQADWIARWPKDEKKPIGFLDRHKAIIRKAIQDGKAIPAEVLLEYPDLRKQAVARREIQAAKIEPGMEIFASFAAGEVPLSRVLMSVQALQRERKRLQASVKELEQKVQTVSGIGDWLVRERRRLDLVEKRIAVQKLKERMQKRLMECYERRQADKQAWKLRQQQRSARIKRDSVIARIRQIRDRLPNMTKETALPIRELLENIDLSYLGKRAVAKVAKLRIELTDPDFEVPPDMLDLLDRVDQRNIGELTDEELMGLRDAIVHWVEANHAAQYYRIANERIRAEQLVYDAVSEMRPPKEVAEDLQRFFPLLWEKAQEKGTTILDEFLGIGQTQWILIVENLAGRDSWMYKVLGEGVEEGRRKQLELKFFYEDAFDTGVRELKIANLPHWLHEEQPFRNAGASMTLRRGEKLALHMLGQDEDARGSVLAGGLGSRRRAGWRNKPRKISEGLLEEVARSLDPAEQGFIQLTRRVFDLTYSDMNEVYVQRYGHPLPQIENWYHKDTMPVGRASSLEDQKAIEDFQKRNYRPGLPKGRVKSRKGVVVPLYLNSIEHDIMQAINYAATYSALEIPVYQASKLLMDGDFRTALVDSYGERTWKHLIRGLRDIYTEAESLNTVENFFAKTREMMTIAWLSLNPFTAMKIFLGFENANVYVHLDYLVSGYAEAISHPKQTEAMNLAMSVYYRDRAQRGFTRDLAEGLKSLESAGLIRARRTMAQYGMMPLQLADRAVVSPVMRGAVLQVLEEIRKGELSKESLMGIGHLVEGKDLQRLTPPEQVDLAYRFADFVITRTQDQRLPEYRSALSRSTRTAGFLKFFTMFGSNTNTNLNILRRAVGEFNRAKDKGKAAGRLAHIFFLVLVVTPMSMAFVNALRNHLLKRYGDDDDEQKKMWFGVLADYARELTGLSYFIREVGDAAITILQKHRVREFTVPPVQLLNDLFEVARRGFSWATATDRYDRNKRMWAFLDKASEWLLMVGEIPLVMPKRYLIEYLRRKETGE